MKDILLLVLGAVAGVFFERIYRRFVESVPRVSVLSSMTFWQGPPRFNLRVTNVGSEPLPPYDIVLRHPSRGSLRCFRRTEESERLPGQHEQFSLNFTPDQPDPRGDRQFYLNWLTVLPDTGATMSDEEFRRWSLQFVLTHSDDVALFENGPVGSAIADIIRCAAVSGEINPTGEQARRVHANNSLIIRGRRHAGRAASAARLWVNRLSADERVRSGARWVWSALSRFWRRG